MKKFKYGLTALLALIVLICTSCSSAEKEYYKQRESYIHASGTVEYYAYNEDSSALYIEFSELTPAFDDNCFKIVGENLQTVRENGIDDFLEHGNKLDFVTAQKYFGDGYVFPIVGLSVEGETLLEFEEGWPNLIKWLENE